jgi:hypothetical protein
MSIKRVLVFAAALAFLGATCRGEQQKSAHPVPEDRIKKLEERADAAEKAVAAAAMEKDYITRTQKLYESYYQKTFNMQLWTLGIVGALLVGVFGLVARFSLNLFEQRTKLATADATAQLRNEYARTLAKEVQKLWDSNAGDNRKLKEALTAQTAELEQNLRDRSELQMQFLQGLAAAAEDHHDESLTAFRQALAAYKSGKTRARVEAKVGAAVARYVFESLRKKSGEDFTEQAREEMSDPLYNGLEEELALAALQSAWLTPLVNERRPAPQAPQTPEAAPEARQVTPAPVVLEAESQLSFDEESDSCRLISS